MKKNLILTFSIVIGLLYFSCTKEKSDKAATTIAVKSAQTKSDSIAMQNVKKPLGTSCRNSILTVGYPFPGNYIVIATFPSVGSNTVLPKRTWRVGNYELNNQSDGNLVIYNWESGHPVAIWDLNLGYNTNPSFQVQIDMNFVAYKGSGQAFWDTGSYVYKCSGNSPRNARLVLTAQGDMSIICDGVSEFGVPVTMVLGSTETNDGKVHTGGQGYWAKYDTSDKPNAYGGTIVY